jgi:LysR family hydrogen peroxide-inducible transcriptional activator
VTTLPTIKQLRYLLALDEHRHFGRAAAACFVTQSAFSIAIRELETLLRVQLVDRTNKRVTITDLGRDIVSQARLVLRDMEMLVELARSQQGPLAGRLKLGVIPTVAPFLLPGLLPRLRRAYPKLQLFLREDITARIYDELLAGDLDLILIALPYELRNVEVMKLFRDRFRLACHRGTHLVDPEHYAFNRLNSESVLLLEDGHCLRDHALSACRLRSHDKLSRFAATSLQTLVQMVDNDLGITFLPEMCEDSTLLKSTQIRTYPLPESSYREIGLVWRQGSGRTAEFRELGAFIQKHRRKRPEAG